MEEITIGSDLACTICVNKTTVAAKHCTIETDEKGHFTVTNHEPDFETWVNGEKVENKSSFEKIDTVKVGDITLSWNDIQLDQKYDEKTRNTIQKKRNGFVSFWLYWGMFVNLIMIPLGIITYQHFANPGGDYLMGQILLGQNINPIMETLRHNVLIMQVVYALGGLIMIICYWKLLNWRKIGFWGFACTSIIVNVVNIILLNAISKNYSELGLTMNVENTKIMVISAISIIVLWAILQIRKDGISCWKQLE